MLLTIAFLIPVSFSTLSSTATVGSLRGNSVTSSTISAIAGAAGVSESREITTHRDRFHGNIV